MKKNLIDLPKSEVPMEGTAEAAGRAEAVAAGLERFNDRVGVAPKEVALIVGGAAAAVVATGVMETPPPKPSDSPELRVVAAGAGVTAAAGAGEPNDSVGATVAAGTPVRLRPTPPNMDGLLVAVEPNEKPLGGAAVAPTNEVPPSIGAAAPSEGSAPPNAGAAAPNAGAADVAVRENPPKSKKIQNSLRDEITIFSESF
jgi:hypothetical protein